MLCSPYIHTYIHTFIQQVWSIVAFQLPATLNSRQDAFFKAGGSLIHEVCMYNTQLWGLQVKLGDFSVSSACNHHLQTTHLMQSCLDLDMKDAHTILVSVWHTASYSFVCFCVYSLSLSLSAFYFWWMYFWVVWFFAAK